MSEVSIIGGLQTAIRELTNFADADVVINDFRVFDQWVGNSPYVILSASDEFTWKMDSSVGQFEWNIGLTLVVKFDGWKSSLDNFVTYRQQIADKLNADDHRTAGGLSGVDVREIRSMTPILPWTGHYVENSQEAHPIFIFQDWGIDAQEF